jgi:excisionase family DNA binding protein
MIDEEKLRALILDCITEALERRDRDPKPDASYLSIRDAAKIVGCGERTIAREVASGRLPAAKRGSLTRIARGDLEQWIRANPVKKGAIVNVAEYARRMLERADKKKR